MTGFSTITSLTTSFSTTTVSPGTSTSLRISLVHARALNSAAARAKNNRKRL